MKRLLSTHIGRLRIASILDGVSWVILAGIAVPLKWIGGITEAVHYPGMVHGALFVLLCLALFIVLVTGKLSFKWCVITFLCSLIPLAPFFLDRKLREFQWKNEPQQP